jgi:hypothetical protein
MRFFDFGIRGHKNLCSDFTNIIYINPIESQPSRWHINTIATLHFSQQGSGKIVHKIAWTKKYVRQVILYNQLFDFVMRDIAHLLHSLYGKEEQFRNRRTLHALDQRLEILSITKLRRLEQEDTVVVTKFFETDLFLDIKVDIGNIISAKQPFCLI